jgi:leucyl aminopeptidase (aminopeptidase T)
MQPVPTRPSTELMPAARRIATGSLGVLTGQRVLVVHDRAHLELAGPIAAAITESGGAPVLFELEELGPRPHTRLHEKIREAMGTAQATVLVCGFHGGEYAMRTELVEEAGRLELRHAHMVGVSARSMLAGVAVDSRRIETLAAAVLARMKPRSVLRVRSTSGTDLTVKLDARNRWVNHTGVVRPGTKENLPAGELVTCPGEISGVYVANGTLGDATGSFAGSLTKSALILQVEAGVVKRIEGSDGSLARRIQVAMRGVVNLDRVALVSLGTNFGLREPVGEIFVDQTLPSVHLSLGLTFPERTGASWTSESWIGFTATGSDVELDGAPLMKGGRYTGGLEPSP